MSDEAFLSAIRETPDDDTPRLIYADWLADNGDPQRGDFIRLQCRLARMPDYDPARFDVEEAALDLLAEHRPRWLAHLPKWARDLDVSFERGMAEVVRMGTGAFLRQGERLAELLPLRRAVL